MKALDWFKGSAGVYRVAAIALATWWLGAWKGLAVAVILAVLASLADAARATPSAHGSSE